MEQARSEKLEDDLKLLSEAFESHKVFEFLSNQFLEHQIFPTQI